MADEQNNSTAVVKRSLVEAMAAEYGLEANKFVGIVRETVMPTREGKQIATDAMVAAFLQVAHTYKLNPFFREIYAFPTKTGGIQPIVSVDGWLAIANREPNFDGYEYEELRDEKKNLEGGKITIYLKNRPRPFIHREYFSENKRNTDPWNNMPRRMMENRTTVQGLRRALGIHGIMDQDEAEAMNEINITGESTEMERTTNDRTEQLKERIGVRKAKQKTEEAKPIEATPVASPQEEAPAPAVETPAPTATEVPPPPDSAPPFEEEPAGPDPEAVISEADRQLFLTAATIRFPGYAKEPDLKNRIQKAIRQRLMESGYSKTAEIRNKDLSALMSWAEAYKV